MIAPRESIAATKAVLPMRNGQSSQRDKEGIATGVTSGIRARLKRVKIDRSADGVATATVWSTAARGMGLTGDLLDLDVSRFHTRAGRRA